MKHTTFRQREKFFKKMWDVYMPTLPVDYREDTPLVSPFGRTCAGFATFRDGRFKIAVDSLAPDWIGKVLHEIGHCSVGHIGPLANQKRRKGYNRLQAAGDWGPVVDKMQSLTDAIREKTNERQAEAFARKHRGRWELR